MIRLRWLPEPEILTRYAKKWTEEFIASGKVRPESRRYAHKGVKDVLRAISAGKCFYCEWAVPETEIEVDHHVEVAENKDLSHAWGNPAMMRDKLRRLFP